MPPRSYPSSIAVGPRLFERKEPTELTDIFLSYNREDSARAKVFADGFQCEGFSVWWDATLRSGEAYDEVTEEALESAKAVVVLWSPRSVVSRWVRAEATVAGRNKTLVPVMIEPCKRPIMFELTQTAELSHWQGNVGDTAWRALVSDIRGFVAKGSALTVDMPAQAVAAQSVSDTQSLGQTGLAPIADPAALVGSRISRRATIAGGIGALAVAGVGGWAFFKSDPAIASTRIAVMSFSNMSGDPGQAYFSDGIAEELRGALSRIGMQVIGKASCDAVKDLAIPVAAAKLDVANILTGSVRRSAETIRVDAQLVSGKDGVEKWAQNYDRAPGDTIKIQTDIATQVASALSVALGAAKKAALTLGGTADSGALDLYLQASALDRNADSPEVILKVIALTEAMLARDPNYGDAYLLRSGAQVGYGTRYATNTEQRIALLDRAQQSVLRAASLMPGSGLPAARLAGINSVRLDFAPAVRGLEQAVASNPNDVSLLEGAIFVLATLTDGPRPLQLADRAITLDPLNPNAYFSRGICLYVLHQFEDAILAFGKALTLAPQRGRPRFWVACCQTLLNRVEDARGSLSKLPADDFFRQTAEALLAARSGDRAGANAHIAKISGTMADQASYQYAEIYAQLGDLDKAFSSLEKAVEIRDPGLQFLKHDPFFDPIRHDPRFAALVTRLKFPI